ncbi:hypothetical protein SADUNF_Sadunf01G0184200 [Salix dunnii]|uniref:Uncharacterized protein n=1 Tax=Salix dunnii TaxID=1413687 RepID=A0A835TME5_9ROSI|nr:hypothetical protein SADUNF_Sadunf01G0184200 [Salix dunnii]
MGKPLGSTGEFFRRRDEWRKHPMLTNQFRHATPGLGIALVAFGIYLSITRFMLLPLTTPLLTLTDLEGVGLCVFFLELIAEQRLWGDEHHTDQ